MAKGSRRWKKRLLLCSIGVLILLIILGALAFSPIGERRIQHIVESAMTHPDTGESLTLGSLSLSPGGQFAVGPIAYQKGEKLKVEVAAAEGRVSLFALLAGKVHVSAATVRDVAVQSTPPQRKSSGSAVGEGAEQENDAKHAKEGKSAFQPPSFLVVDHLKVENIHATAKQGDRLVDVRGLDLECKDFPSSTVLTVKNTPGAKLAITPGKEWPPLALGLSADLTVRSDDLATASLSGTLSTAIENLDEKVAGAIAVGTGGAPVGHTLTFTHHLDLNYSGDSLEIGKLAVDVNGQAWLSAQGKLEQLSGTPALTLAGRTAAPLRLPLSLLSAMDAAGKVKADGELDVSNLEFALQPATAGAAGGAGAVRVSEDIRLTVRSMSGPASVSNLSLVAKTNARRENGKISGGGEGSFTVARLEQNQRRLENVIGKLTLDASEETRVVFHLTGDYSQEQLATGLEAQGRVRIFGDREDGRWSASLAPKRLPAGLPVRPMRLVAETSGPSDFSSATFKNTGGEWTGVASFALDAEYSQDKGISGKIARCVIQQPAQLFAAKTPADFPAVPELAVGGEFKYQPRTGHGSVAGLTVNAPGLVDTAISADYDGKSVKLDIQRALFTDPARLIPPGAKLPPLPALPELRCSGSMTYLLKDKTLSIPSLAVQGKPNLDTVVSGKASLSGKPSFDVKMAETDLDLAPWSETVKALAGQEMRLAGRAKVGLSASGREGKLTSADVSAQMQGLTVELSRPAAALDPVNGTLKLTASPVAGRDGALAVKGAVKLENTNARYEDAGQKAALSGLSGSVDLSGTYPDGVDARWDLSAAGVEVPSGTFPFTSQGPLTTKGTARLADGKLATVDGTISLSNGSLVVASQGVALHNLALVASGKYDAAQKSLSAQWKLPKGQLTTPAGDAVFIDGLSGQGDVAMLGDAFRIRSLSLSATQPVLSVEIPAGSGDPKQLRSANISLDCPDRRTLYPNLKVGGKVELPLQLALEPLSAKGTLTFTKLEVDNGIITDVRFSKLSGTLPVDWGPTPLSDARLAALSKHKEDDYRPNLTIGELRYAKRKLTDIRAEISLLDQSVLVPRLVCLVETPGLKLPHRVETWGWAQVLPGGKQRYRFWGNVKAPSLLDPVLGPVVKNPLGIKDNSVEAKLGAAYNVAFEAIKYATAEEPELSISAVGPGGQDIVKELFGIETTGGGGIPLVGTAEQGVIKILKTGGKLKMLLPEGSSSKGTASPQVAEPTPEAKSGKKSEKDKLIDTGLGILDGVLRRDK